MGSLKEKSTWAPPRWISGGGVCAAGYFKVEQTNARCRQVENRWSTPLELILSTGDIKFYHTSESLGGLVNKHMARSHSQNFPHSLNLRWSPRISIKSPGNVHAGLFREPTLRTTVLVVWDGGEDGWRRPGGNWTDPPSISPTLMPTCFLHFVGLPKTTDQGWGEKSKRKAMKLNGSKRKEIKRGIDFWSVKLILWLSGRPNHMSMIGRVWNEKI